MKHILPIILLLPCLSYSMDETEAKDCQTLETEIDKAYVIMIDARADWLKVRLDHIEAYEDLAKAREVYDKAIADLGKARAAYKKHCG